MGSSESDFSPGRDPEEASSEEEQKPRSRSAPLLSQPARKRRRSGSPDSVPLRSPKERPQWRYNDAYRILLNETVNDAAGRFDMDLFDVFPSRIGASPWSQEEKALFFGALERLGKDNTPGIAAAVGTKSALQVREFILLLQDAYTQHRDEKLGPEVIPAAVEIGRECEDRLELAADVLAAYQEQFEATQEQERYGQYWLITAEVAEEVEAALRSCRPSTIPSSPPVNGNHISDEDKLKDIPQILEKIPEARLLVPEAFLRLSKDFFMNPHPAVPYPWPHWTELVSEHANSPSLYHTAFRDIHHLAVSLTERLVQVAIFQATSRIRAQTSEAKHTAQPIVRKWDVFAAIDILGMKRNGKERWRGVARRCGLQVLDVKRSQTVSGWSRRKDELSWDEVEEELAAAVTPTSNSSAGSETDCLTAATEDEGLGSRADSETDWLTSDTHEEGFGTRAVRSGTPLPPTHFSLSNNARDEYGANDSVEDSDGDDSSDSAEDNGPGQSGSVQVQSSTDSGQRLGKSTEVPGDGAHRRLERNIIMRLDRERDRVERFDGRASREEERRLWDILGELPHKKPGSPEVQGRDHKTSNRIFYDTHDWRDRVRYHAEWEEFSDPVPRARFAQNQKPLSYTKFSQHVDASDAQSKGTMAGEIEIPLRGAREYAALQEQRLPLSKEWVSSCEDEDSDDTVVSDGLSTYPIKSIEHANTGRSAYMAAYEDEEDEHEMDLDTERDTDEEHKRGLGRDIKQDLEEDEYENGLGHQAGYG